MATKSRTKAPAKKAAPAKAKQTTNKVAPAIKAKPKPPKKTGPAPVAQDKLSKVGIVSICNDIIEGIGYRAIAKKHGVGLATLALWIENNPEHSHACARAREISAQTCDEKALEGIENAKDKFQLDKAKEEAIHLRWRAKAVNPKRYGDKVAVGGASDLPPVQTQKVHSLTTEQLVAIASGKAG